MREIKIRNKTPIKAMAFGGCSFTWGQGLWYYSALDKLPIDPMYGYAPKETNAVHHAFREKWRWPSQVADHFNTVAVTHYENGGANDQMVEYWKTSFASSSPRPVNSFNKLREHDLSSPINYSDVSHFVFQFTQWMRSRFVVSVQGTLKRLDTFDTGDKNHPEYIEAFEKFISGLNIEVPADNTKIGAFHQSLIQRDVDDVKQFLQHLESQGIKTHVLCWPWEHVSRITSDPWLSDRFITFDYNGKNYKCIEELIKGEECMSIETDTEFFEVAPTDGHPSLRCNNVIAENVIKFIERKHG